MNTSIAFLSFMAAVVCCGLLGAVVHELAHYAVWQVAGRQPEIDWRALHVDWTAGPDRVRPSDRVAAAAPVVLGILILPAVAAVGTVGVWVGWLVLTVGGARGDYKTVFAGVCG
jgi:hypothetical protein